MSHIPFDDRADYDELDAPPLLSLRERFNAWLTRNCVPVMAVSALVAAVCAVLA